MSVPIDLDPAQPVALYQEPGRRPRHCQLEATPRGTRLCWMLSKLDAGAAMQFQLVPLLSRKKPSARLRWKSIEAGQLQATLDGLPFALFDGRDTQPFPGLQAIYAAGDVPEQAAVAGLWPTAGLRPPAHHRTEIQWIGEPVEGPVFGRLASRGVWRGPGEQRILEELLTYTLHATPSSLRLVDIALTLRARFGPVRFTHDGPLKVRLDPELSGPDGLSHSNSEGGCGLGEVSARRSAWVHAVGRGGVALFDHPDNTGHPCRWQLDDGRSLCPAPFGEPFVLAAGEVLTFRYRLCLLGADADGDAVRDQFLNYAHPPVVELIAADAALNRLDRVH